MSPILFGLSGLLGISFLNIVVSLLNRNHDAFKIGFLIQLGNGLATLSLFPLLFKENPSIEMLLILSVAGFTGALAFVFINKAFKEGKASINAPIISTWGMMAAILGFIIIGEEFYFAKFFGMLIILVGIFLSSIDLKDLIQTRSFKLIAGAKWSLLAALNLGISYFIMAYFSSSNHWYTVSLVTRIWTVLTYISLAQIFRKPVTKYFNNVPYLIYVAIVIDVISFLLINIGYTTDKPGIVSMITSASPALTMVLAYFFLKERVTKTQLFGIIIVVAGIISLALY